MFRLELEPKPSLVEIAHQVLREAILDGRLEPGERLVETRTAKEMGISRGPMREAVQRLIQEGLVENVPRHGTRVAKMSVHDIHQLYRVRVSLEKLAVVQAIERDPVATADRLEESIGTMEVAARSGISSQLAEEELRFHQILCEMSGNMYLVRVYKEVQDQVRLALLVDNLSYPSASRIVDEHRPLLAAIRAERASEAEKLIEHHILESLEQLVAQRKHRRAPDRKSR